MKIWGLDNKRTSLLKLSGPCLTILASIRIAFSCWHYGVLAGVISTVFLITFSMFDQLLFFSPVFAFYLPDDATLGFTLSTATAILLGIVVSMNIFVLKHSKGLKINLRSFLSGSTLGVLSSACASCSSLGFLLVSVLGGVGVTTSTFLSNYQIPLRIISVLLLLWALYSIGNKLTKSCSIHEDKKIKKY